MSGTVTGLDLDRLEELAEPMLAATLWTCSECERTSVREHWDVASGLYLRGLRLRIERGELNPDYVWIDDEVAVCPRCKFEHHDDEDSAVDESFAPVAAPSLVAAAQTARRVEALFNGGPDTACRTVWQDGIECVSVPIADLRAALGTEQEGRSE